MGRASVRSASRCSGGRLIRRHHCAAFAKRYATMRSNRPSAAAAARKSAPRAFHARARKLASRQRTAESIASLCS
eukprot:5618142-Lingulodinium_polyedra.AAC.1